MSTSTSHPASGGGTGTVPVHWHGWIHSGRKLLQLETLHETEQGATDELLHHGGLAYAPAPCAEISCLRGKRPRYLDSRELPSNPERFKMMGGQAVAGRIARGEGPGPAHRRRRPREPRRSREGRTAAPLAGQSGTNGQGRLIRRQEPETTGMDYRPMSLGGR